MTSASALDSDHLRRLRAALEPLDTGRLKRLGVVAYFGVYAVIAVAHVAGGWRSLVAQTQRLPPLVRPPHAPPLHEFLGLPMSVAWSLVSLTAALAVVGVVAGRQLSRADGDEPASLSEMDDTRRSRARDRAASLRDRLPARPERPTVSRRVRDGVARGDLRDRLSAATRRGGAVADRASALVPTPGDDVMEETTGGAADAPRSSEPTGPVQAAGSASFDDWRRDEPSAGSDRRLAVITAWIEPPTDPLTLPRSGTADGSPPLAAGNAGGDGRYSVVDPAVAGEDDAEILEVGPSVERGDLVAGSGGTDRLPDPEAPWPDTASSSAAIDAEPSSETADAVTTGAAGDESPDDDAPWPDDWIPGDEL